MFVLGLGLWTLFFYSLVRFLFLVWNHASFKAAPFTDLVLAFFYGLRFDLSAVAILSLPALLILFLGFLLRRDARVWAAFFFALIQVPFLILNLGEIEYVHFNGRRFTLQTFAIAGEAQGKFWAIVLSYAPLFFLSTILILIYLVGIVWITRRLRRTPVKNWFRQVGVGSLILLGFVIAGRGGLQKKPVGFAHAQVFLNPSLNHVMQTSSFTLIQSLRRTPLPRENYMTQDEMLASMNGALPGDSLAPALRLNAPQNVILIVVESLTLDMMGRPHGDQGYTPFLDELASRGLFFPQSFANGRRSIEGIAALVGGVPALMTEPFISSPYATNTFYGLGTVLASQGYSSAFYHGGENGTMYFDQFMRSAGVQRYYGAREYPESQDHDGTWGIWDVPFLQKMVEDLKTLRPPFAATVFTLSSHNPFKVPPEFEGRFPKGTSEIHEVMGYADEALRGFFARAELEPWYKDTLFIVTGDHTYRPVRARYQDELGQFRVPLFFFHPQIKKWPELDLQKPVQHIDVLPSVLDFLGVNFQSQNLMGRSVFRQGGRYVVLQSDGFYTLVSKGHTLTMDSKNQVRLYELQDPLAAAPPKPLAELDLPEIRDDLLHKLKATRQYFSEGLWDNRLYFPSGR